MAPVRAVDAPVLLLDQAVGCAAVEEGEGWAVLRDHVVVFTTRMGAGGEPGATVVPWPGARAMVRLSRKPGERGTFLAEAILEEDGAAGWRGAWLADAAGEPVLADGRPVRIADVPTTGCPLPALSRRALLDWLRRRLAPDSDPAAFRTLLRRDQALRGTAVGTLEGGLGGQRGRRRARAARSATLHASARPSAGTSGPEGGRARSSRRRRPSST